MGDYGLYRGTYNIFFVSYATGPFPRDVSKRGRKRGGVKERFFHISYSHFINTTFELF